MSSNLECFLSGITPMVPSLVLPKSEMKSLNKLWHPWERETVEYFTLGDLWNSYDEWSAYGAGVPITLSNVDSLVQYYVPYLSAIQIFTTNTSIRRVETESGESETYSDTYSDESSECETRASSEEGWNENDFNWQVMKERLGHLYFQYFERSTPYARVPLVDKITGLARRYPGLMTLRSVDLSPASWMAVAWYPIYHIPMGRTIKDLTTCFLTYHTLSSSFLGMDPEDEIEGGKGKKKAGEGIALKPFGMATYKMQQGAMLWVSGNHGRDQETLTSLFSCADSWLKQLKVDHHDFNYFQGIRHHRA